MSSEGWVDVEEHESCNGAPVSGTAPRRGGAVPEPGGGQVLVKIEASGVCHTDLHAAEGDRPVKLTLPFIPGQEGAGVVAPVGPGATAVREGDRVGVAWLHRACGHRACCVGGWETRCEAPQNSGYSVNGALSVT